MILTMDMTLFNKKMKNLIEYSSGFLDGVQDGKKLFSNQLGKGIIEALGQYIDSMARQDQKSLHHVYEWAKVGQRSARLFDLNYFVTGKGLSISSTFSQSKSIKDGSSTPFYDKARVMENGIPVTIKPSTGGVLRFDDNGVEVFTKKPVLVQSPGGRDVKGAYANVFDNFMKYYFTQAFLSSTGLYDYIKNPQVYKTNISAGVKGGRGVGQATGYKWIISAKVGVE